MIMGLWLHKKSGLIRLYIISLHKQLSKHKDAVLKVVILLRASYLISANVVSAKVQVY